MAPCLRAPDSNVHDVLYTLCTTSNMKPQQKSQTSKPQQHLSLTGVLIGTGTGQNLN